MEYWHDFVTIFVALFVITDPFGNVGIFLSITEGDDLATRRKQAMKASFYVFLLLFVFFVAGTYIMHFFGITLDAIRIGGGLIVAGVGFGLMRPKKEPVHTGEEREESEAKDDVSFTPLAMPLLAGPGALAVVIAASAKAGGFHWGPYVAITLAILAASVLIWICLREAVVLERVMGKNGMGAVTRIMGFLLVCIAVEMVIVGTHGVLTDWGVLQDLAQLHAPEEFPF